MPYPEKSGELRFKIMYLNRLWEIEDNGGGQGEGSGLKQDACNRVQNCNQLLGFIQKVAKNMLQKMGHVVAYGKSCKSNFERRKSIRCSGGALCLKLESC